MAVDWVLYSVWHPAWDVIWKCDNGKRPLSQNQYFRKLITEVLAVNTTPSDAIATSDLKVIKVQGMKEDGQGKLQIIGALEVEARRRPIKWNPTPDLLGRLLKYVVSVSDLIVQYKYPETLGTGNSKGKLCFIHITPKGGQPDCFELSEMGAQVSAYNINYDYYQPEVVKCVPVSFKFASFRTKKNVQEPVEVEATSPVTVVDKAKATSRNLAAYVFGSPGPSPVSSPKSSSGRRPRPNVVNITDDQQYQDQEAVDVGNAIVVAQSRSPSSDQIEEMEISDGEENGVSHNPIPSGRAPDFNLTSFLRRGQFVPGPLTPKVKKPDKQNVYHTLEELEESRSHAVSNRSSDESFFSATSDLDQPGDNNSQSMNYTLFKDLKMKNEPLNLLCQIVSLNEHREGTWCLILKDLEQTVPSDNFKQPQSSVANPSGLQLGVNIKNGIGLEKRGLLSMLQESQATEELYAIPNVTIKGIRPPYTLEIDGNSTEIRRDNEYLMRFFKDPFTSGPSGTDNPQEGASSNTVPDNIIDEQLEIVEDINSGGVVAIGSMSNNPAASDEDPDVIMMDEIPFPREVSSSPSDFVSASHTPSRSPVEIDRQESPKRGGTPAEAIPASNQVIHDVPEEPWTGRLRGRRKPRQYYQSEDSFEC